MSGLALADLVANRTMSAEIAATLRDAVRDRRSFLVVAIPRFAGKTTLTRAMLATLPRSAPLRTLGTDGDDPVPLVRESEGGYFVLPEISRFNAAPGYVWGRTVRTVFRELGPRNALAVALHAPGADEALDVICRGNGVAPEDAAKLALVAYIRTFGPDPEAPSRRVIATVHEVSGVRDGRPRTHLLHRWDERADTFSTVRSAGPA